METKTKQGKIIALSSYGSEILPFFLKELALQGLSVSAVLLDGVVSEREKNIQVERTKGFFVWPDFSDIEQYDVPLYCVKNHNSSHSEALLKNLAPDILINAGTPRIIKENILNVPIRGVVNTHPGFLPAYQGCTVVEWAIYNNDPIGATCHFMTKGIDDGPIIYTEAMPIRKGETYEEVRTNMLYHVSRVMAKGLKKMYEEDLSPQNLSPQSKGAYYKVMTPEKIEEVREKLMKQTYHAYILDGSLDSKRG